MSHLVTTLALSGALLMLGSACAKAAVWPPDPATLQPGEESCAGCRMFVSDPRFAAQRHARDGSVEWFDDLGCLLEMPGQAGSDPRAVFVHAFEGDAWLRGDRGHAVRTAEVSTPMGYGWLAYATPERARVAIARHADAELFSITDLLHGGAAAPSLRPPDRTTETPERN